MKAEGECVRGVLDIPQGNKTLLNVPIIAHRKKAVGP